MRPRAAISAAAATACILIIGWQVGAQNTDTTTPIAGAPDTDGTDDMDGTGDTGRDGRMAEAFFDRSQDPGRAGPRGRGPDAAAMTQFPLTAAAAVDGRYIGPPVPYPRGSVSVTATIADGTITDVDAVIAAENPVSQNVNERVEALLDRAVLTGQSSDIAMISGSTYTSQAYAASLQAALDEATP